MLETASGGLSKKDDMTKLQIKSLADMGFDFDGPPPTINDTRFRRGFSHGYLRAIEDIENRGIDAVIEHYNGPIMKWRFSDDVFTEKRDPPDI